MARPSGLRYPLVTPMPRAVPPLLFALAVIAHVGLMVWLGNPWPGGFKSDGNVYLELAQNLWLHGEYGSRVAVTYPPLYPMMIAPTTALPGHEARFAGIYALHALWLAAASLLLLPMLRDGFGRTRAWVLLAGAQLVGGATIACFHPQTEALFAALLVAATGLAYLAVKAPSPGRWFALGLVCGLAFATRRMALALALALAVLLALEAHAAWRRREPLPWLAALWTGVGVGVGLLPEAIATLLQGQVIEAYSGNPVAGHLKAGAKALAGPLRLLELLRVFGRHPAYLCLTTLGAPAVLCAALHAGVAREEGDSRALGRTVAFIGVTILGLVGMTTLHIVRYTFRAGVGSGWDLYPRYMDPVEVPLLLVGIAAAGWLLRERGLAVAVARVRLRAALPWVITFAIGAAIGGPLLRSRGGRLPSVGALEEWGFGVTAPWLFLVLVLLVLGLSLWWWTRGRWATPWTLLLAALFSWGVSTHSVVSRAGGDAESPAIPIYDTDVLREAGPAAPIAVMVEKPGSNSRYYYEPAFRSDHVVDFLPPDEVVAWAEDHPDGFVLVRSEDQAPRLRVVARKEGWQAYRSWSAP